jgi:hypothetical protein
MTDFAVKPTIGGSLAHASHFPTFQLAYLTAHFK